ncbi:MAG: DUF1294 domain-containing protein [Firmicutes bacterium]|nr:DUF1294 domain-containing protein [Bacillota bacterium]
MGFMWTYLKIISILTAVLTAYDKYAAQTGRWRIKERTLLLLAACGGSVAIWLTMHLVRHKTRKAKFVVGIPLLIFLQLLFLVFGLEGIY